MRQVKINGVTYELDSLNDEVKSHLKYLSFIDSEAERLTMQLNVLRLSREQIGRMLDLAMARHTIKDSSLEKMPDAPGAKELDG